MSRRTHAQVVRDAIVAERTAMLAFAREHARQVAGLLERGRVTADEATLLARRVHAFADGIAQGLHVAADPVELRRAMRDVVVADARERGNG